MQTLTMLELKVEEAQLACKMILRRLRGRWLASWLLPDYYNYFQNEVEYQLELLDEILGLIATSQKPLRRTESLSRVLVENGLYTQPFSLIQMTSNQGAIARELSYLWQADEEKMAQIEDSLREFNKSQRELQRVREQVDRKWQMDLTGFPPANNLPQMLSMRLLKELSDPDLQPLGHTIIEVPTKRLTKACY